MNPTTQAKNSATSTKQEELGFTWWFVWSWISLAIGVPLAFMTMLGNKWFFTGVFLTLVEITICIYMLKYNRYAFIAGTALTLNPILWIINGIYVKNRWEHPKVVAGSIKKSVKKPSISKAREPSDIVFTTTSSAVKTFNDASNSDYASVANEIASGNIDQGLWTRLFVETDGDENRTRARYIKARIASLTDTPSSAKHSINTSLTPIPDSHEIIWLPASSLALQREVEYGYLNKLYGGSSSWLLSSQATIEDNGRILEKLDICLTDGRTKTVWFDITQAWAKTAQQT